MIKKPYATSKEKEYYIHEMNNTTGKWGLSPLGENLYTLAEARKAKRNFQRLKPKMKYRIVLVRSVTTYSEAE